MSDDVLPQLEELVPQSELSEQAQALIEYANRHKIRGRTSVGRRNSVVDQYHAVFDMIGGIPRFALWADKNPNQFYSQYSKLLPKVEDPKGAEQRKAENMRELSVDELRQMIVRELSSEE